MIVYITGASGVGKTTLLDKLTVKGVDLDDLNEANWKKHGTLHAVMKGVKQDCRELISKHADIVFVGLQTKEHLGFTPDVVYIMVRKDIEKYYRDKLLRDFNLLRDNTDDFEQAFDKGTLAEIEQHLNWYNDVFKLETFKEFKTHIAKVNKAIQEDFPEGEVLTFDKIVKKIESMLQ